jgi:hypothetical protein
LFCLDGRRDSVDNLGVSRIDLKLLHEVCHDESVWSLKSINAGLILDIIISLSSDQLSMDWDTIINQRCE